ncbi:helix-turn-helix domain-containing protein [Sedimenticola sp.]|uniref:helix-turn-helix domain-containing protein n=1 Tax=Sedimenticola sp. TaxID=1940285 RepID=UPI003D116618
MAPAIGHLLCTTHVTHRYGTIETVSRVMGRFQKQNITSSDLRNITLLDLEQLKEIAGAH